MFKCFAVLFSRLCEGANLLCRAPSTFTLTLWNTEADLHGNPAASTAISSFQEINDGGSAEGNNRKRERREKMINFFISKTHKMHLNTQNTNAGLVYSLFHSVTGEQLLVPLWKKLLSSRCRSTHLIITKVNIPQEGEWEYTTLSWDACGGCCGTDGIIVVNILVYIYLAYKNCFIKSNVMDIWV